MSDKGLLEWSQLANHVLLHLSVVQSSSMLTHLCTVLYSMMITVS